MPSLRANYSIGIFIPLLAVALWVGSATMATSASDTQRAAPPTPAAAPTLAGAQTGERVGDDTCLTCHEKEGQAYGKTAHARVQDPRSPAAAQGCETCHGPGKAHVDTDGDKTKIHVFTSLSPQQVSETCVTCHNRQEHASWEGSAHSGRNLSCVTCHSVHEPKSEKAQLKKVSVTETCQSCHRTQANKLRRSAHVPVREGKMECSSCHNPHGSTNVRLLRVGNTINEACVSCHAEKRGPFLWDHGQYGTSTLANAVGALTPFDLKSRRDTAAFVMTYTATRDLDVKVDLKNSHREGAMPFGGLIGSSPGNMTMEIPAPIDDRTSRSKPRWSGRTPVAC